MHVQKTKHCQNNSKRQVKVKERRILAINKLQKAPFVAQSAVCILVAVGNGGHRQFLVVTDKHLIRPTNVSIRLDPCMDIK
jgi:hypothetical protein